MLSLTFSKSPRFNSASPFFQDSFHLDSLLVHKIRLIISPRIFSRTPLSARHAWMRRCGSVKAVQVCCRSTGAIEYMCSLLNLRLDVCPTYYSFVCHQLARSHPAHNYLISPLTQRNAISKYPFLLRTSVVPKRV